MIMQVKDPVVRQFGGLWKHENNQHALIPRRQNVAAQVAEELKTALPLLWRNAEREALKQYLLCFDIFLQ